ncbi:MAG: insulinase family protein, partial [Gammaproteobacteria bacterium]|nr:insulinase family protein [Gammaproteobacteria bacterium]
MSHTDLSQRTLPHPALQRCWQSITSTVLLAGLGSLLAGSAPAASAATSEFELDNGLKLIVQEDHRAPVAVVQVWYRVGSSYEHDGITGVSHALEHMMFKGTEKL